MTKKAALLSLETANKLSQKSILQMRCFNCKIGIGLLIFCEGAILLHVDFEPEKKLKIPYIGKIL